MLYRNGTFSITEFSLYQSDGTLLSFHPIACEAIREDTILNSKKKNAEKEVEFMAIDDNMAKEIATAVPSASMRWKKVNNSRLDHNMKTKYGLTQTQITQFKTILILVNIQ